MVGYHLLVEDILENRRGVFMSQITKEQIMDQVYNLILNIETKENERKALINFKNEIEAGKNLKEI